MDKFSEENQKRRMERMVRIILSRGEYGQSVRCACCAQVCGCDIFG